MQDYVLTKQHIAHHSPESLTTYHSSLNTNRSQLIARRSSRLASFISRGGHWPPANTEKPRICNGQIPCLTASGGNDRYKSLPRRTQPFSAQALPLVSLRAAAGGVAICASRRGTLHHNTQKKCNANLPGARWAPLHCSIECARRGGHWPPAKSHKRHKSATDRVPRSLRDLAMTKKRDVSKQRNTILPAAIVPARKRPG